MEGVVLKGVGQDYNWDYLKSQLVSGELLSYAADSLSEDVLLSKTMAERLKLSAGDDLMIYFVQDPLRRRKLHISGLYQTWLEDLDKLYLIGTLGMFQRPNNGQPPHEGGKAL